MASVKHAVAVRPERTVGEIDLSDREKFLLQALLNLTFYIFGIRGEEVLGDAKGLLFQGSPGPKISPKIPIGP